MDNKQKFLFDLQGFLVVEDVLTDEQCDEAIEKIKSRMILGFMTILALFVGLAVVSLLGIRAMAKTCPHFTLTHYKSPTLRFGQALA